MKQSLATLLISSTLLFSGCASYQAAPLAALPPQFVQQSEAIPGLTIGCKQLSENECKTYLDRNIIKKGYTPIELTFYNQTENSYLYSSDLTDLPQTSPEQVAKSVHTSTLGRIAGYTGGSFLVAISTLSVPIAFSVFTCAIVDGIKSSSANNHLDQDFQNKARSSFIIEPGSYQATLLFVPQNLFSTNFHITLTDQDSKTTQRVPVTVLQ